MIGRACGGLIPKPLRGHRKVIGRAHGRLLPEIASGRRGGGGHGKGIGHGGAGIQGKERAVERIRFSPQPFLARHFHLLGGCKAARQLYVHVVDVQAMPGGGGHRVRVFYREGSHYPMAPSISSLIRLFISTAYSSGSSFDTGSANPFTIIVRASSSDTPRLIR